MPKVNARIKRILRGIRDASSALENSYASGVIPAKFHVLIPLAHNLFQAACHGKPLIMAVSPLLKAFCFVTGCLTVGIAGLTLPLDPGLDSPDSLTTVSLNESNHPAVEGLCTSSLLWVGSTSIGSQLTTDCFLAWKLFLKDFSIYKNIQFEFLQQGATASYPGTVKMATPRRYINSESNIHVGTKIVWLIMRRLDLCTIAIVNLADIPRGILPSQPPGPFPRSDLGRFTDFRTAIVAVRAGCLGRRKEVGWAVSGTRTLSAGKGWQNCLTPWNFTRQAAGDGGHAIRYECTRRQDHSERSDTLKYSERNDRG